MDDFQKNLQSNVIQPENQAITDDMKIDAAVDRILSINNFSEEIVGNDVVSTKPLQSIDKDLSFSDYLSSLVIKNDT